MRRRFKAHHWVAPVIAMQLIHRARLVQPPERNVAKQLAALQAKDVRISRIRSGKKYARLVSVHMDLPEEQATALMLTDANFKVSAWVHVPARSIYRFRVLYLVDVDGDGRDEFVIQESYYEGSYTKLGTVRTKPTPPRSGDRVEIVDWETLSGDGACPSGPREGVDLFANMPRLRRGAGCRGSWASQEAIRTSIDERE